MKTLYKNNIEGTTRIVANIKGRKEGEENQGRYIQYVDEDGEEKFISIDAYKKILKGTTQRQDVNAWIKSTAENLETDKSLTEERLKSPEAVQAHINSYISDPSVLRALEHQYGVKGSEQVSRILEEQLKAEKGIKAIKQVQGRQQTTSQLSKVQESSQRAS